MTTAHVDFLQIGATFTRATGAGNDWIDTGITIPSVDVEALIGQIRQYRTSLFAVSRLVDLDPISSAAADIADERLSLSQIGVSANAARDVYLGRGAATDAAPNGTLHVAATDFSNWEVSLYALKASDIAALDLDAAAMARLLPTPTEETRGRYIRQSEDGETYEFDEPGDPPPDQYRPRFTTLDRVIRALRVSRDGAWREGGDLEADVLNMIAAAEAEVVEWCGDRFDLAATDSSERVLQAEADGILLTPPFAADPISVAAIAYRGDTSDGVALDDRSWWPVTEPSGDVPGRHLEGSFDRGSWYRISGRWGWPMIPHPVRQAAELLSVRLAHRQVSPLGLIGGDAPMYVSRHDTDVRALLAPFSAASLV